QGDRGDGRGGQDQSREDREPGRSRQRPGRRRGDQVDTPGGREVALRARNAERGTRDGGEALVGSFVPCSPLITRRGRSRPTSSPCTAAGGGRGRRRGSGRASTPPAPGWWYTRLPDRSCPPSSRAGSPSRPGARRGPSTSR